MPLKFTERDQLMRIQQQLQDHENTQARDLGEIKATANRIENKLDSKSNSDDVKRIADLVADLVSRKADKEDLKTLDQRIWFALISAITALLTAIVGYLFRR